MWSEEGPVIDVGVEPLCLVQSKTSVTIWVQLHMSLSKSQFILQSDKTKQPYNHHAKQLTLLWSTKMMHVTVFLNIKTIKWCLISHNSLFHLILSRFACNSHFSQSIHFTFIFTRHFYVLIAFKVYCTFNQFMHSIRIKLMSSAVWTTKTRTGTITYE